ncbi:phosphoribosylformylglycinamidine synthase [Marinigracilibium pacificum]|uniref:Phosphoribosylformylglycinamidine synthase n=1 Tax=Marinigracilibium pacificum TaxID=2729599 RepID=A0A848J4B8_9BACT|nr:phosphoribosylformylglycinamidine synthase [Marinigracilibium pacificum]NMM50566.1 phosphoribosylformylglycinamidine synthase [Marinigracilibium pacificum]
MILFYKGVHNNIFVISTNQLPTEDESTKLHWLLGKAERIDSPKLTGKFKGPRTEMITPWSTNAVEITQNMGINGIDRIEQFYEMKEGEGFDKMLEHVYEELNQSIFDVNIDPEEIKEIDDIRTYNESEGLALNDEEIEYLENVSKELGRKLTDSEVFGFSQVNSEHCRHKIFNGKFIIDGKEKKSSLFQLIKKTSKEHPNKIVSAYKDNVAFVEGPRAQQFAPVRQDIPEYFAIKEFDSVLSLKAETHNFPTTVEPFNGAATGSGGEIRDRIAGGKGSMPVAGTAVYMTSYSRTESNRSWENHTQPREWLYQTPLEIMIKASNGASDFGNKFGQPLICGSLLTFEHKENDTHWGFDKVIMLAGGIGYGKKVDSLKATPETGDKIIVMGGDNYRIGMGGSAVSSVATGEFANAIELNAIQRSNPEMQKRVYNAIRAMAESDENPIVSIHDHGAGGHLNCLSELVEEKGGEIEVGKLPVGDPTLSEKEIIGNESQERMGLIMKEKDFETLKKVSERERAPLYKVGEITGDMRLVFKGKKDKNPIDLKLSHFFGSSPQTIMEDTNIKPEFGPIKYSTSLLGKYIEDILQIEAVASKDWLTNKVDRSVTGKVAKQQTAGEIQIPLNNVAVIAADYQGVKGTATSIGHAPVPGLISSAAGSRLSIAEALTNIVWAPLTSGLEGISLSANWMWPCNNPGEDARLYDAVEAVSDFCVELGINVPTGKDSLSMTQKYKDGKVYSPGTVIISAIGEVENIRKTIEPVLQPDDNTDIIYIDFSNKKQQLGGSSFAQLLGKIGDQCPDVDVNYFKDTFKTLQKLIKQGKIMAGHDISSGGLFTAIAEMCFGSSEVGVNIDLSDLKSDLVTALFSENPGVIVQTTYGEEVIAAFKDMGLKAINIGNPNTSGTIDITKEDVNISQSVSYLRKLWMRSSYLLDQQQSGAKLAEERYNNIPEQKLEFKFPENFVGSYASKGINPDRREKNNIKAAIIREKGVNGDREMAWALYLAGFDVKDVHMTDLISGRETLEDVNMIVFVGGFSNSDVLGSAKGWAGAFKFNEKANEALHNFYKREDTLSLGVCNGCQLMMELGLLWPEMGDSHPTMHHNDSHKFESGFVNMTIPDNDTVMLKSLSGTRLGVWVAHGEGKFVFEGEEDNFNIVGKYSYSGYPGNPNGSQYDTAAVSSKDGRHLAMMPHLERSLFPWNWAYISEENKNDEITPWVEAFVNAKQWIENNNK